MGLFDRFKRAAPTPPPPLPPEAVELAGRSCQQCGRRFTASWLKDSEGQWDAEMWVSDAWRCGQCGFVACMMCTLEAAPRFGYRGSPPQVCPSCGACGDNHPEMVYGRVGGEQPAARPEPRAEPEVGGRNPTFEAHLKERFGLSLQGGDVGFDGHSDDQYASQLSDPQICLALLRKLQGVLRFDQVCVLTSSPPMLVCGSSPPVGLRTSLNADGLVGLIAEIVRESGKQPAEYKGVFLVHM